MKWKAECDEVQNGIMVCVMKICLNYHWHNCVMTSTNNEM
jgi:hypothetical protein